MPEMKCGERVGCALSLAIQGDTGDHVEVRVDGTKLERDVHFAKGFQTKQSRGSAHHAKMVEP